MTFCFEGGKEYFLALQLPEENGEGGQISREVGEIEVIERLKNADSRCWLPMLVVARFPLLLKGMRMKETVPLALPCDGRDLINVLRTVCADPAAPVMMIDP